MKLQLSLLLLCAAPSLVAPAHAQETEQVAPALSPYDVALDRAFELGEVGRWDEARAELAKALDAATAPEEKSYVFGQMGATYEAQGNHGMSQAQFRKAKDVPDAPIAQKNWRT